MIIGLGHQKQVGKDTVADYLVRTYDFEKVSFADSLKEVCKYIAARYTNEYADSNYVLAMQRWKNKYANGLRYAPIFAEMYKIATSGHNSNDEFMFKIEDGKFRRLLQYVGTDLFRKENENFWVESLRTSLQSFREEVSIVIVDVRFPNEKKFVEEVGTSVHVVRSTGRQDTHESETALLGASWNFTITNDGDLSKLMEQTEDLVMFLSEMQIRSQL